MIKSTYFGILNDNSVSDLEKRLILKERAGIQMDPEQRKRVLSKIEKQKKQKALKQTFQPMNGEEVDHDLELIKKELDDYIDKKMANLNEKDEDEDFDAFMDRIKDDGSEISDEDLERLVHFFNQSSVSEQINYIKNTTKGLWKNRK